MRYEIVGSENGLYMSSMAFHTEDASDGATYRDNKISSFKEGLRLEDSSILTNIKEFEEVAP
jgi:hypothetical protein